jgi:hypothetical protein
MINELSHESKKVGLKKNNKKTKIMFNNFVEKHTIKVENIELEEVNHYIFLGQQISMDGDNMAEIKRIKLGWTTFGRNSMVLKGNIPWCLKRKVFNQFILPVLTYGSETWTLTKKSSAETSDSTKKYGEVHVRNYKTRQKNGIRGLGHHISRCTDHRRTLEVLDWISRNMKRPRKRPRRIWLDENREHEGIIHPAVD